MNQLNNIMMSEFGNFKLGDLGIARTMEKTTGACHLFRKEMLKQLQPVSFQRKRKLNKQKSMRMSAGTIMMGRRLEVKG